MKSIISRRQFISTTLPASFAGPFLIDQITAKVATNTQLSVPKVHIFSKHLHFLSYKNMAEVAKEIGFDGIDLTIRPSGHVEPEDVETNLPLAVEAMKLVGYQPNMFCTTVEDVKNKIDQRVLGTASKLGFKFYRMNWYKYPNQQHILNSLAKYQDQVTQLSKLNADLNLVGAYQNHAGKLVGATLFEVSELLKKANNKHMGVQYDIRHATAEGGLSWQTGFNLIQPHIKTIVLKDFLWAKTNGRWKVQNVPIGDGMVDFDTYFKMLKALQINVPICLHLEYPLGGAENGSKNLTIDKQVIFKAMKQDLIKVKELWLQA